MSQMRENEIHPRSSGSILNFIENQTISFLDRKIIMKISSNCGYENIDNENSVQNAIQNYRPLQ